MAQMQRAVIKKRMPIPVMNGCTAPAENPGVRAGRVMLHISPLSCHFKEQRKWPPLNN